MNKFLRRAIMTGSKLKNKANKTKHPLVIKTHKKQRNHIVDLNKVKFFNNLDCKKDTKTYWDKCKPYFSNKHTKIGHWHNAQEKRRNSKK